MDASYSILLGIVLFLVFILIPLIPAILIYKIFPDTKVGAQGLLGQLKINATGAFAAYLIVILIGYPIIAKIHDSILATSADEAVWSVKSKVVLMEMDGQKMVRVKNITDEDIQDNLNVKCTPDYSQKDLLGVAFPTYYRNKMSRISFAYNGFESQIKVLDPDSVHFNYAERIIDVGIIKLTKMDQEYKPKVNSMPNNDSSFSSVPTFN
jgi:hypothetical protein